MSNQTMMDREEKTTAAKTRQAFSGLSQPGKRALKLLMSLDIKIRPRISLTRGQIGFGFDSRFGLR